MKNFDGKELKIARDKRDLINGLSRKDLFDLCKKNNIVVSRDKNDELRNKLKKFYYSNLEDYEISLLNKETSLSDDEIDTYVKNKLNELYKESFKEDNKPKIDSDLRLINAMRGKK
jgi:hypothetical protein